MTAAREPAPFQDKLHPVKFRDVTEGEFFTPLQVTKKENEFI